MSVIALVFKYGEHKYGRGVEFSTDSDMGALARALRRSFEIIVGKIHGARP